MIAIKYSLDWILKLRKDELSIIETELADVNVRMSENIDLQSRNKQLIEQKQIEMYNSSETWKIANAVRVIENCENINNELIKKYVFLDKERNMVLKKYNSKLSEIKLLEKNKENQLKEHQAKKDKRAEEELNSLYLISKTE